jgi:hypothetical protein
MTTPSSSGPTGPVPSDHGPGIPASGAPASVGPAHDGPVMPVSAKVSVGVLAALAVLLLLNALFTALAYDAVVDAFADARPGSPRSDSVRTVQLSLLEAVVFGGLSAVAAWSLPRRRGWARLTGLAAVGGLGAITLVGAVVTGLAVSSLLVLVLCAAAVASLVAPTTAAWAPAGPRSRA